MIWIETTHIKKHGEQTACCVCVYCAGILAYERVLRNAAFTTVTVKTDDYQIPKKLMHVCHESYEGIKLGARLVRNS